MSRITKISRRDFAKKVGAWAGAGLILGIGGPLLGKKILTGIKKANRRPSSDEFSPSVFISIGKDGKVRLVSHRSEMGQGVRTSMLMLIAEELNVDLNEVIAVQADGDEIYGDQNTDGSKSVSGNWTALRVAGAAAREMLVAAASKKWTVKIEDCTAQDGKVFHSASGKSASYGELATLAATLPVPRSPKVKNPSEFRIVGKARAGIDLKAITGGTAQFGIDVEVKGMLYASIERSPTVNGTIKSVDSAAAAAMPGVAQIVRLPRIVNMTNEAVAVIADSTWSAQRARHALKIEWNESPAVSSELSFAGVKKSFRDDGDFIGQKNSAARVLEATYSAPYLVHAPMEPMSCTARVTATECEVWAPTQDPQNAQKAAAEFLGFSQNSVTVHVTFLGGGFGRKSQPDFVLEAVAVAKATGKTVKVTWTREDEIRHGFYHAESLQHMTATLDSKGALTGWHHQTAFPTIGRLFDASAQQPASWEVGMGCTNMPYKIPNVLCEAFEVKTDVRIAWLRSVCNLFHSFAVNSFMDEIAFEMKRDPVELRIELLHDARYAHVIEKVAKAGAWGQKRPKGTGMGFACHFSFGSYVATLIEVTAGTNGVKVDKVYCAIDCGAVVNPDSVKAQMEGAVIFGLSAALTGQITVKNGKVEQSNFHDYPVMRMDAAPEIHVHLVKSDSAPAGVGEPGVPPVAPALCSAIFNATGVRPRALPISKS